MKRLIFCLLMCLSAITAEARGRYAIYEVKGSVKIKRAEEWIVASKHTEVSMIDILLIAHDARIGIIDYTTNRIFFSKKTGEQRVAQLINAAKLQTDEITKNVNEQIRKSITQATAGYSYQTLGASHRGFSESNLTEIVYISLCNALDLLIDVNYDCTSDLISLHKTEFSKDSFYFTIINRSEKVLYINILAISKQMQSPLLCFNLGYSCDEPYMLIPPHAEVAVKHFVFGNNPFDNTCYLLFGSIVPFDGQELQALLCSTVKPEKIGKVTIPLILSTLSNR